MNGIAPTKTTTMLGIDNRTGEQMSTNMTGSSPNHHFQVDPGSTLMILQTFQMILNILNVVCHGIGITFLRTLYERTEYKVQYVYLISLSGCELIINILSSIQCTLELIGHSTWPSDSAIAKSLQRAIDTIYLICATDSDRGPITPLSSTGYHVAEKMNFVHNQEESGLSKTGFSLVFFVTMIYITLDRLLDIYLNIRYNIYWNPKRAISLIKATWTIGVLVSIGSIVINEWNWEDTVFEIFYPVLEIGFIVLALFTYTFIFRKFKAGRKPPHQPIVKGINIPAKRQNSTFEAFKNSRFYISVLLIFTFILFMIIPDLSFLFLCVVPDNIPDLQKEKIRTGCWILYGIANLSDAFIYIFLQVEVKKYALSKIRETTRRKDWYRGNVDLQKREKVSGSDANEATTLPLTGKS